MSSVSAVQSKRNVCVPGSDLKQIVMLRNDYENLGAETRCPELNRPDLATFSFAPRAVAGTFFCNYT